MLAAIDIVDDLALVFNIVILRFRQYLGGIELMMAAATYSIFTNLNLIDAQDFGLFRSAQTQAGDQIHEEKDEACSKKRIRETRHRTRDLVG